MTRTAAVPPPSIPPPRLDSTTDFMDPAALSRAACLLGLLFVPPAAAGDWPAFRGPRGDGIAGRATPPLHWGPERNVRWRVPVPGTGNGSPVVVGDSVYLAFANDLGRARGLACFDRADGRLRWHRTVAVAQAELTHKSNPYAASTPAVDGRAVVVWHGTGGLHCYSPDGAPLWSRDFGPAHHLWGYGNSPVPYHDRVILHCGTGAAHFVAAVRLADGADVWRFDEPGGQSNATPEGKLTGSWATPVVARVGDRDQLVCAMPTRVVALDADTGRPVWTCRGLGGDRGDLVYASPVVADGIAVVTAGYMGPAVGVRLGGTGDVTDTHRAWRTAASAPQRVGSGVAVGDCVYVANADGGSIECLDLRTGRRRWRERVRGGPHWASTVLADGLLFATNQGGTIRVVRPNPDRFELVAENHLGATVNATPAFAGGEVFIRTDDHLYCIAALAP
jgi:outer membrane protein assembly factor BamB